jgi:hypothetical protein
MHLKRSLHTVGKLPLKSQHSDAILGISNHVDQPAYLAMDNFMQQKPVQTDKLFWPTPSTEHEIEQSQMSRMRQSMVQTIPRQAHSSVKKVPSPSKPLILIGKQILFALDTVVLGLISYQLFTNNLSYLILSWCLIALFWLYLANKKLRLQTLLRIQKLLRLPGTHARKETDQPTVNPYRNAQLRELQNDTTAYLKALRTLHIQGKQSQD